MQQPVPDTWTEELDFPMMIQILKKLGVEIAEHPTRGDVLRTFAVDVPMIDSRVRALQHAFPQQFQEISAAFSEFVLMSFDRDWAAPHEIEESVHRGEDRLHSEALCETWDDVRKFMISEKLTPHATSAVA